jgi:CheY-like chemotaxis protein
MLLDAVEELRPHSGTAPDSPLWRPYHVLHGRYILGKDLDVLETELGLSKRQVQREQRAGFAAVAIDLWANKATSVWEHGLPRAVSALSQEISRVATKAQVFDVLKELESALGPIRAFSERHRIDLLVQRHDTARRVLGNPSLLRQLLVSALSFVVRLATTDGSAVRIESQPDGIACYIVGRCGPLVAPPGQPVELPEPLVALARASDVTVAQECTDEAWCLQIGLPPAPESHTVAIVEDNKDLVKLYSRYLGSRGYRLVEVSDSTAALTSIAEIMPDAVVLDLVMSEVDGWQILQRLQADSRLRHIPVAVCSVLDEGDLAASLGAKAYLRKPVRPAQLLECLANLLS